MINTIIKNRVLLLDFTLLTKRPLVAPNNLVIKNSINKEAEPTTTTKVAAIEMIFNRLVIIIDLTLQK